MIKAIAEHRSVRKFDNQPIHPALMGQMLRAATRASTIGGMQLYSIIVTEDTETRALLAPCHFNQPMVVQAGAVVTFCADVRRFSLWCEMRGAKASYHNFGWWVNAAIDTLLASENFALEAENLNLGICYLGTTLYTTEQIIEILELPHGVIPITTIVVGHPAESEIEDRNNLTPRLPLEAVVHYGKYTDYTSSRIDELFHEMESSEQTARLLVENDLPNLARIFTERRYTAEDSAAFSASYRQILARQGFIEL